MAQTNLDYMEIYASWVDKATELSNKLCESACLDGDEIFDEAYDALKEKEVPFKDISTIIVSEILYTAKYRVEEKLQDLGFEEGKIQIDIYPEGLYSSIIINMQNQSLTDAVANVLAEDFEFIQDIDYIMSAVKDAFPKNIDELFEAFANELSCFLPENYNIEFYYNDQEDFTVDVGYEQYNMNISELRNCLKEYIEKNIDKNISEKNENSSR